MLKRLATGSHVAAAHCVPVTLPHTCPHHPMVPLLALLPNNSVLVRPVSSARTTAAAIRGARSSVLAASGTSLEAQRHSSVVERAGKFYHDQETNDFHDFSQIVTPDVKWRQRGLLQGSCTHSGAEDVHRACRDLHDCYQDLTYTVNTCAEEDGRAVLFWTASGVNRKGLFGQKASFHRSTFSGVTLVYTQPDGRIRELIEYRQPTHEEMAAFLRTDSAPPGVKRLLSRGHAVPCREAYCLVPAAQEVPPEWRIRAVQVATEWVENWTPQPDLEKMVREDMEEYNIYSWPDFEQDVIGRAALEERSSRNAQDAVVIRDTVADSATNLVAIHWYDFEQQLVVPPLPDIPITYASEKAAATQPYPSSSASAPRAGEQLPERSLPRQQPTLHPEHGSVELVNGGQGGLRVHLGASAARRSDGSMDLPFGVLPEAGAPKLHKYRGVTLLGLDQDCKLAWQVTFRELKATEETQFLKKVPS